MGKKEEKFGDVEWIDPDSGSVVHGETLSAKIQDRVPGVRGHRIKFHPMIEGRRPTDDTTVHAFFMNDSDGQPFVGIREVPTLPETN